MKIKILIFIMLSVIFTVNIFSVDFSAYSPVEYKDFINTFKSTNNDSPGMSFLGNQSLRVRATLHEFPKKLKKDDIENIKSTLTSLGFPPNMVSEFGYKVEYVFPSNVDWEKEARLVFYVQKIQKQYFEKEYKLNDVIYWFVVFNRFNTLTQRGYFLVSDFINQQQFEKYGLK